MQDKDIDHSQSSFHSQSVIEEDPKINDYECITDSQVLERQQEELLKYINKIAKRVDYAVNRGKYSRFSSLCEYLMELIEGLYEAIFGGIFKNKMREVSGEKTASFAHRFIKEYNDSTFTDRAEKQELLSEKAKAL